MPDLVALRAANADRCTHAELTRGPEFLAGRAACAPAAEQRYLAMAGEKTASEKLVKAVHLTRNSLV